MIAARAFLTLAETWSRGSTEAEWRCSISRAYYAAFHECRTALTSFGFVIPRADLAHAFLWKRLENSGHDKAIRIGTELSTLRRDRNQADYDLHTKVTQTLAVTSVGSATWIVATLESLTPEDRVAITEAMKIYERDVLREPTWRNRPR